MIEDRPSKRSGKSSRGSFSNLSRCGDNFGLAGSIGYGSS